MTSGESPTRELGKPFRVLLGKNKQNVKHELNDGGTHAKEQRTAVFEQRMEKATPAGGGVVCPDDGSVSISTDRDADESATGARERSSLNGSPASTTAELFCLRWDNYQSNVTSVFDQLLHNESYVDVTLACDGRSIKAHKMVLSACSPYFQSLFNDTPPYQHPIVIMRDVCWADLEAIVEFMYKGEINVTQEQIEPLLRIAEMLKVRGLADVTSMEPTTAEIPAKRTDVEDLMSCLGEPEKKLFDMARDDVAGISGDGADGDKSACEAKINAELQLGLAPPQQQQQPQKLQQPQLRNVRKRRLPSVDAVVSPLSGLTAVEHVEKKLDRERKPDHNCPLTTPLPAIVKSSCIQKADSVSTPPRLKLASSTSVSTHSPSSVDGSLTSSSVSEARFSISSTSAAAAQIDVSSMGMPSDLPPHPGGLSASDTSLAEEIEIKPDIAEMIGEQEQPCGMIEASEQFLEESAVDEDKSFTLQMIREYEGLPILWNKNDLNYLQRTLSGEAWKIVLKKFQQKYKDASISDVKLYFKKLRESYHRERRRLQLMNIKTGHAWDDFQEPTLFCFYELKFLNANIGAKKKSDSLLQEYKIMESDFVVEEKFRQFTSLVASDLKDMKPEQAHYCRELIMRMCGLGIQGKLEKEKNQKLLQAIRAIYYD